MPSLSNTQLDCFTVLIVPLPSEQPPQTHLTLQSEHRGEPGANVMVAADDLSGADMRGPKASGKLPALVTCNLSNAGRQSF